MASNFSAAQAQLGFFDMPDEARESVYRLLLVLPHPLYLFQDNPSEVGLFAPDKPSHWTATLCVNRRMNREASAVAYSANQFYVVDAMRHQHSLLQAFFTSIGPANVSQLAHICMCFPAVDLHFGEVKLCEDDLQSLKLLREECTNLRTMETHMQRRSTRDLDWTDEAAAPTIRHASIIYNTELRTLRGLERIVVKVHGGRPTRTVMEFMQGLGWNVLPANRGSWA